MKKVMMKIAGMTCNHCEQAVEKALDLEGVMDKKVSYYEGCAVVCFNPQQVSEEKIANAVNQTGNYKVTACEQC